MFLNIPATYLNNSLLVSLLPIVSFTIYFLQVSDLLARFRFLCFSLALFFCFLRESWKDLKHSWHLCISSFYFLPCFLALFRFILPEVLPDMFGFPFGFVPHLSQVHSCFGFPSNTSRNNFIFGLSVVISYQLSWFLQSPCFPFPIHCHLMRHVLKLNPLCCLISTIRQTNHR